MKEQPKLKKSQPVEATHRILKGKVKSSKKMLHQDYGGKNKRSRNDTRKKIRTLPRLENYHT